VKNRKSKIIAALAAIFLFLTIVPTISSAADPVTDERFAPSGPPVSGVAGYTGVHFEDGLHISRGPSFLGSISPAGKYSDCESLQDPKCADTQYFHWRAYLSPCLTATDFDCIESLAAIKEDGSKIAGVLSRKFPTSFKTSYKGDPSVNLPSGGEPSLWHFDGITHTGGTEFFLAPNYDSYNWYQKSGSDQTRLQVGLYPVSIQPGANYRPQVTNGAAGLIGGDSTCVFVEEGNCLRRESFPSNIGYEVKLRLKTPVLGWIHARMRSPNVSMIKNVEGNTELTISASPVLVPVTYAWAKNSDLPASLNEFLDSTNVGGSFYFGNFGATRNEVSVLRNANSEYDEQSFKEFALWLPVINDKAAAVKSTWSFRTLGGYAARNTGTCFSKEKELSGVVTTNATVYVSSPPTFNTVDQTLDYKVASPHFDKDGTTELKGNYDLAIRSDVARCLYGYTSAPISATISVVSASGTNQIATTVVNEKNGWLYLSANNFGYSAPTLKVKLIQDAPTPVVTPTPTPTPTATIKPVPIQKTIVCVKGKTTKKIKAISPKCPSGYKKK